MHYLTIQNCKEIVFPYIYDELIDVEPTASYEEIEMGMQQLEKVLSLVQNDSYYPEFPDKCSYILCSIVGSQYFPNGNKRLGVITLLSFLILNDALILSLSEDDYKELLVKYFPNYHWDGNINISDSSALFLYNLAIVIGDRMQWSEGESFDDVKKHVTAIMEQLYSLRS